MTETIGDKQNSITTVGYVAKLWSNQCIVFDGKATTYKHLYIML